MRAGEAPRYAPDVRIPTRAEVAELDRAAILDDIAPYVGLSAAELDEVRHALCRLAAEQWDHWPERAKTLQDPRSAQSEALWLSLVRRYRVDGTAR